MRVDARVDAYVPAAYIAAEALKIDLHRRIALAEHEDELRELRAATEDRYGPLPEPVENLFAIQEAKLEARARSAPTTSSSAAAGRRSGRSRSAATELRALRGDRRHRRLHVRPPARSRSAPRGSRGRSRWPMLSLPLAGPPERGLKRRHAPDARTFPNTSVTRP